MNDSEKKLSVASQIFALEEQATVFENLSLDLSNESGFTIEQKRKLTIILEKHGKGLMSKGRLISSSPYCDEHLRKWARDICAKIELHYLILLEEYLESEECTENEREFVEEIDKHITDYSSGVEIYN